MGIATGQRTRCGCWASSCCSGAESWRARIKLPSSWERKEAWGGKESMRQRGKSGIYMALRPVVKIYGRLASSARRWEAESSLVTGSSRYHFTRSNTQVEEVEEQCIAFVSSFIIVAHHPMLFMHGRQQYHAHCSALECKFPFHSPTPMAQTRPADD